MKQKQVKPKNVRAIRFSDSMWAALIKVAAQRDMRASEYVRRLVEDDLRDKATDHA